MARPLYPAISPFQSEWLATADGHQLYIEQCGNPSGIAAIYLHGGPGAGCSEHHRRYFDPERYRIILLDQRGCGRSKPSPSIENNTMDHLLADIELVRQHLGIEKWLVCGGSFGTTIALMYGLQHKNRVLGLILRGIFLGTDQECQWLYEQQGAAQFFPDYYQAFLQPINDIRYQEVVNAYNLKLNAHNELAAIAASKAWYLWEMHISSLDHPPSDHNLTIDMHQALCMAKISAHFFSHQCFINADEILLRKAELQDIPAIIIHGRYDMVCQISNAFKLAENWPLAQLQVLPHAGHSGFERQTIEAICKATDNMANYIDSKQS